MFKITFDSTYAVNVFQAYSGISGSERQIMTNTHLANGLTSRRTAVGRIDFRAKRPDSPLAGNSTLFGLLSWKLEI